MHNLSEIREHIGAIQETRKITNAMELVSSSRLRKVMAHIEYNHNYFLRVQSAMKSIIETSQGISHPYLITRGHDRRTYIVIAADKGLCGSYNTDILEVAYENVIAAGKDTTLITVGIEASEYFMVRGIVPDIKVTGMIQDPSLHNARALAQDIFDLYDRAETDEVFIIGKSFYGETKNKTVVRRLLPVRMSDYKRIDAGGHAVDMIYEPSPQEVFSHLVPQYIIGILFGSLVQAYASEHFARMNAMSSATKSADEMLKKLRQQYNMARQSAITREITEISGASETLIHGDMK